MADEPILASQPRVNSCFTTVVFRSRKIGVLEGFSLLAFGRASALIPHSPLGAKRMQLKTARIAGALYLLSAVAAGLPLIYISSKLLADYWALARVVP